MFAKRIPFEMAAPGVDPTTQHNPLPRQKGKLKDVLPWLLALVLMAGFGYQKFISPTQKAQKAAQPVATPAATATLPRPSLALSGNVSLPTSTPIPIPTSTPTPTVPPPAPTPTPIPANIVTYGVFVEGQQVICWCNVDTGELGDDLEICQTGLPSQCVAQRTD